MAFLIAQAKTMSAQPIITIENITLDMRAYLLPGIGQSNRSIDRASNQITIASPTAITIAATDAFLIRR
jgi:hypothetical protein